MQAMMEGVMLVVIGAARGTEHVIERLLGLLPLPSAATVVIAVQGADERDVSRLLVRGPPELRVLWGPQPVQGGGLWVTPPGRVARVEGCQLVVRPSGVGDAAPLAALFGSAAEHPVLGVLLGDLGAEGDAAAAAFGDGLLLRPDVGSIPARTMMASAAG